MWQQRIVIGRRGIQRQDFAVRLHLHMFHLAFSSGEEHASAAFHSIARAQSRGFEPRWPSIRTRLSAARGAKSVARLAERLSEIDGVTSVQIADANFATD
jgi:hypothetical protein